MPKPVANQERGLLKVVFLSWSIFCGSMELRYRVTEVWFTLGFGGCRWRLAVVLLNGI